MRRKLHISFEWWFTLFPFLLVSSPIIMDEILTPDFSDFGFEATSIMAFAILSEGLFEFKST